jgi:acyl transferase domain-containing protein/acyl-CoA synthetase (AMP-forming)/AMP-acid ligase II/acyl carrier protein/NAD(P)-dependent dehydrogenase (short-subunit alcohol dehydrogenase family)
MATSTFLNVPEVPDARTIVEVLQWRAERHGERLACTVLTDGEQAESHLTYAELDAHARAVGSLLAAAGAGGERALLLLPTGVDFVRAFFGCLYAGVTAVPFYPPRPRHSNSQLRAVIKDARPVFALTTSEVRGRMVGDESFSALRTIAVDEIGLSDRTSSFASRISEDDLAYLQYTSGSTRQPRGVTVRHGQLLRHMAMIWRTLEQNEHSVIVSWLPLFHDMGLVGTLLTPLAFGARTILTSPGHFLMKPVRWLQCMSRYRATSTGAPNFAYDLCVERTTPEDRQDLDLSNWTMAFSGAEPVRATTIERFAATFAPCGFRLEAFYPCYGLAEATLLVTGGTKPAPPVISRFTQVSPEDKRVAYATGAGDAEFSLVGCGRSQSNQRVLIVDPDSRATRSDFEVGEIWVAGPTISTRYWNEAEEDSDVFSARTTDGDGPFLRTGDLGFLVAGELYVTGRLKNLLIIRGQNHHSHDIEYVIQMCHPSLAVTRGAVFTVEKNDSEDLVVVQEVARTFRESHAEVIVAAIRRALAVECGLNAQSIVLVRFGSIPKTSSGKTMRYLCSEQFRNGQLRTLASFEDVKPAERESKARGDRSGHDYGKLLDRLRRNVAGKLSLDHSSVDPKQPFADYGLSSLQLAELAGDLEQYLGREISPSLLYAYPTLDSLVRYLTNPIEMTLVVPPQPAVEAGEPLAIVGLACRFPGAADGEAFWRLLCEGRDEISEVPPDRWDLNAHYDPTLLRPGTTNTKWGGFLDEVDTFDSNFFGISSTEADSMDPQQRLLLEVAWEALEDAGLPLERVKGTQTGVFVGISTNDYGRAINPERARTDLFWCTSNALSIAANRISYFLDVHGPSMAVDTACSSSLVALHLACQSLRKGESEIALVGGVNVMLSPDITINMSQAGATSADGRCKAFDASADGLVRGEGAGVVVLKPLRRALADGDRVYGVVKGTAVNQDGATNGLTAPNPRAQADVVHAAYADAGVSPHSVQYVETHGPGTPLGDPIELEALAEVVSGSQRSEVCRIGSVKTNLGHLEAAAGIAALIKVALALKHGQLPPSLHFRLPNPRIPFSAWKLSVATNLEVWKPLDEGVRRAGVSAFGFGGTNVHVVVESVASSKTAPIIEESPTSPFHILPLSAPNKETLAALTKDYRDYLNQHVGNSVNGEPVALASVVLAAGDRRTRHRHRLAVVGRSTEEIVKRLNGVLQESPDRLVYWGESLGPDQPVPVFVFSGLELASGALCQELLKHSAFRDQVESCDAITRSIAGWSVADAFAQGAATSNELDHALSRSQLALFTLQVSLAALWRAWGVEPAAVVGHSAGEVAAAYVAGVFDLPEAFLVLHERSNLLEDHLTRSPGQGAMAAVRLSLEETGEHINRHGEGVEIAAHNGPALTVCAGEREALERFLTTLNKRDVVSRVLEIPGPGHTSFVEPLRQQLVRVLANVKPNPAKIDLFSTVTGKQCEGTSLGAEHWGRHMREPVAFAEAIETAIDSGYRLFLEIGTQGALSPCIAGSLRVASARGLAIPSLREQQSGTEALACAVAQLYVSGYPISWRRQYPNTPWVTLPKYPWQHKHHWAKASNTSTDWARDLQQHPFLGSRLPIVPPSASWHRRIGPADCTWLRDHSVGGSALVPTTAYLKMAVEAAQEILGTSDLVLEDVELEQGVFIAAGDTRMLQTSFASDGAGLWKFEVHAALPSAVAGATDWRRAASGRIRPWCKPKQPTPQLEVIKSNGLVALSPTNLQDAFAKHGIVYGPTFSLIDEVWQANEGAALAHVIARAGAEENGLFSPGFLDACLQPMALTVSALETGGPGIAPGLLPIRVERVRINGKLPVSAWSYVTRRVTTSVAEPFAADAVIFNDSGQVVAEVTGFYVGSTAPVRTYDAPPLRMRWPISEVTVPRPRPGEWILLSNSGGLSAHLAQWLQDAGLPVRSLETGAESLAAAMADPNGVVGVVDLRFVEANVPVDAGGANVSQAVAETCNAALDAVRVLATQSTAVPARLWFVTRGAVPVIDAEQPSVVQHPLWSLARTVAVEENRVWGGIVDVEPGASAEENARSIFAALIEDDEEDQIAWRKGNRHVARLAPIEQELPRANELLVRPDGTYLITGGLGDLGLQVARWLVRKGARRLILLGRTGLPPRDRWREVNDNGAERRVLDQVLELESLGASVHLAQVDVSSEAELSSYLDNFRREAWPEIKGVFHLAGMVGLTPLLQINEYMLIEYFAPKVAGAWNLHRYFADRELDFFVLFSSGSALLGSPGIGAYAAANGFLDGLASIRRANGLAALSINWGFWRESGMAARVLRHAPDRPAPKGMLGLSNREALALLGRVMSSPYSSVAPMPFDWDEWSKAHVATAASPYLRLLSTPVSDSTDVGGISRAELMRAPTSERKGIVEAYLRQRLARVLEVDPAELENDQQLTHLGIDSLMAVEIKNRVEAELQISIPIVVLLQGVSIAQLATFVIERISTTPVAAAAEDQPMDQQLSEEDAKRLLKDLDQLPESTVTALIETLAGTPIAKG